MPQMIIFGAGAVAGLVMSKGTEDVAAVVKWGVIGGALFVGAKAMKWI